MTVTDMGTETITTQDCKLPLDAFQVVDIR